MKKVLVVGATGTLARPVVERLCDTGYDLRLLARDADRLRAQFPGVADIVSADVTNISSLSQAMAGCDAVHINLRGTITRRIDDHVEVRGVRNVARIAGDKGITHITYLSGAGPLERYGHLPTIAVKLAAEEAIRQSGVPYSIFRCAHFMESLPMFIRGKRAAIPGRQTHAYHYLAARDYAKIMEQAIGSAAEDRTYTVLGPEAFTMREALERYCAVRHPGMRIQSPPLWLLGAVSRVTRDDELATAVELFRAFEEIDSEGAADSCRERFGMPQTTLAAWLEELADEQ